MAFFLYLIDRLLSLVLLAGVLQGLLMAGIFFLKRHGNKQTNGLFGLLLAAFSLTLFHHFLEQTGLLERYERLYFLPVYFTFLLGPLVFFYVKSNLYPAFRLHARDSKHFILPVAQAAFFLFAFFREGAVKANIQNSLMFPYYGMFEKLLYALLLGGYLYFAYRFARHRAAYSQDYWWQRRKVFRTRSMVKVLFALFSLHATYVVSEYLCFRLLGIHLYNVQVLNWLGELSFAAMVYWLGFCGYANEFLLLVEGEPEPESPAHAPGQLMQRLESALVKDKLYLDPDLKLNMFTQIIPRSSEELDAMVREHFHTDFDILVNRFRLKEWKKRMQQLPAGASDPDALALDAGFASLSAFHRFFEAEEGCTPESYRHSLLQKGAG